jgi:hypothetical protein
MPNYKKTPNIKSQIPIHFDKLSVTIEIWDFFSPDSSGNPFYCLEGKPFDCAKGDKTIKRL